MKILITGAFGFIGSPLLKLLARSSHQLFLIHRSNVPIENISSNSTLIQSDIEQFNDFKELKIDMVIDLAWGHLDNFNCVEHIKVELEIHKVFLQRALHQGVKSILVAGTCLEYGLIEGVCRESVQCEPLTQYGQAKLALLNELMSLQRTHSFNLIWPRIFYVFGDGSSKKSLFNHVQEAKRQGQHQFNMSHGNQTRDFISVNEVANIIFKLVEKNNDLGIVNIGSGNAKTVKQQVLDWFAGTPVELNLGVYDVPNYEPHHFWADVDKLNMVLSINAKTTSDKRG